MSVLTKVLIRVVFFSTLPLETPTIQPLSSHVLSLRFTCLLPYGPRVPSDFMTFYKSRVPIV